MCFSCSVIQTPDSSHAYTFPCPLLPPISPLPPSPLFLDSGTEESLSVLHPAASRLCDDWAQVLSVSFTAMFPLSPSRASSALLTLVFSHNLWEVSSAPLCYSCSLQQLPAPRWLWRSLLWKMFAVSKCCAAGVETRSLFQHGGLSFVFSRYRTVSVSFIWGDTGIFVFPDSAEVFFFFF